MRLVERAADGITEAVGHPAVLLGATVALFAWPILDRPFDWLDAVSALTAWLLFVLQASQNRLAREWSAELRELIHAVPEADERVVKDG